MKARELLLANLDPQQLAEYRKHNRFTVRSSRGHLYRIDCGSLAQNVYRLKKDGSVRNFGEGYCAYLKSVPYADSHLAQKLILEADEGRFLRTAWPLCMWYWGWRILLLPLAILLAGIIILTGGS
jgi:hypothetical protein